MNRAPSLRPLKRETGKGARKSARETRRATCRENLERDSCRSRLRHWLQSRVARTSAEELEGGTWCLPGAFRNAQRHGVMWKTFKYSLAQLVNSRCIFYNEFVLNYINSLQKLVLYSLSFVTLFLKLLCVIYTSVNSVSLYLFKFYILTRKAKAGSSQWASPFAVWWDEQVC